MPTATERVVDGVVLVLLDALREDFGYVGDPEGWKTALAASGPGIAWGGVREMFGFQTRPAYLAGLTPERSGICTMTVHAPTTSPFRSLRRVPRRLLAAVDRRPGLSKLVRRFITRFLIQSRDDALRYYASPLDIPLPELPLFDFAEKTLPWEGYGNQPSIFQCVERMGGRWFYFAYPLFTDYFSDERVVEAFEREITSDYRFAFVQLNQADGLGHRFGPTSSEYAEGIQAYKRLIERISAHARRTWGDRHAVIVFGDHGMVEVRRSVDVLSAVRSAGIRPGIDVDVFLDSTLARFWGDDRVLEKIRKILNSLTGGHVVDDAERARYHIRFSDDRYGGLIYLADPGVVIQPNYFQRGGELVRGMHGYDPACPDNVGALMIASPRIPRILRLATADQVDLFPTCLQLLGIPLPGDLEGRPLVMEVT